MTADVVIIGGGLSGLAAAVKLTIAGVNVILCEKNYQLGGRTYSYVDKRTGDTVDNGQHILVGAYHNTLEYLKLIGTEHFLNKQPKPRLFFHHPERGTHSFEILNLPKPFDVTAAMLRSRMLSFTDRQKLLKVGLELKNWNKSLEHKLADLTVEQWLNNLNQSDESKKSFWYPIVISIMNELPQTTSALLFARSLKRTFLGKKGDSSVLISTVGQSELYVSEAEKLLLRTKSKVLKGVKIKSILIENGRAVGIQTDFKINSKYVISAVPHYQLNSLLPLVVAHSTPFNRLKLFKSSPIISIHLWFDKEIMDVDFIGLIDKNLQWVFNRRRIMCEKEKSENYISAVISGAYDYINLNKDELILIALKDIKDAFPKARRADLQHAVVIKEKRATFSATNEVEQYRLNCESPITNLLIAGDWTNTGLPATIEGAVMSGFMCAKIVSLSE